MPVAVVQVGRVRMLVDERFVPMGVRMLALGRVLVEMIVVPVVVPMSVIVLDRTVRVNVLVAFGQVKDDAHRAQRSGDHRPRPSRPLPENPG
jgi:hypothetical protein